LFSKWKKDVAFIEPVPYASSNPFDQDDTRDVRMARIKGPWHPKIAGYLRRSGIKGLELSFRDGFRSDDEDFLAELPFIELFNMPPTKDGDAHIPLRIEALQGLRRLKVMEKVKTPIDFTAFENLQSCTVKWQPGTKTVLHANTLRFLQIYSVNWKDADGLGDLETLENLEIAHSGIRSAEPLTALKGLKRLSLSVCRDLADLNGIAQLTTLKSLHIDEVRHVNDLEFLTPLENLEVLTIRDVGEISSIDPLRDMKNLRAISIAGTKTKFVDGDLSPLTRLPQLAMLFLNDRRHYSHRTVKKWSWNNLYSPDEQLALK